MQKLSPYIDVDIKPVFHGKKIGQVLAPGKEKAPYCEQSMRCLQISMSSIQPDIYTNASVINEDKYSAIGRLLEEHELTKSALEDKQFSME